MITVTEAKGRNLHALRADCDRKAVKAMLRGCAGDVTWAAEELGLERTGLYALMKRLSIPRGFGRPKQ